MLSGMAMLQMVQQPTLGMQSVSAATGMVQAGAAAVIKVTLNVEIAMRQAKTGQAATGYTVAGTAAAAASVQRLDSASDGGMANLPDTLQQTRNEQRADRVLSMAQQVKFAAGRLFRSGPRLCPAGRGAAAHCGAAGDQPRLPSAGAGAAGAAAVAAAAVAAQRGT